MIVRRLRTVLAVAAIALLIAACGDDDTSSADGGDRPTVAVTTNILGDVVERLAGGAVDVVVLMPVGADPHDFQLSARQVAEVNEADALVVNGGGFEEGLLDVIDGAEHDGVPVVEALAAVETIDFGDDHAGHDHAEDDHADDEHAEDDHADEHADDGHADDDEHAEDDHEHEGIDPHFFTDPGRMAVAVDSIATALVAEVDGIDADALRASADAYAAELEDLASEVEDTLAAVADDDRVLVTNHEVFGYFADAYGFEVVGTVIPSGSTADAASAGDLSALAETIEDEGVPAIFTDASSAGGLADTLAEEAGGVEVVELFTESLGDDGSGGETYVDMIRTNAQRIAAALS